MKKFVLKALSLIIGVIILSTVFVGCDKDVDWSKKVTLNNPTGEISSNGGSVVTYGDYVYFINGKADGTDKNSFGTPVHGALMVAEKSNLDKAEIVVPKLLTSTDYNAGFYIFGNAVYYATPSTAKNKDGKISNEYLVFAKTTLDGKKTTEFFTVLDVATEFRMVEKDGVVYIVYHNSEKSTLNSYNTSTKKNEVIAEEPASYKFMDESSLSSAVVAWTMKVKKPSYKEDATPSYETYNEVYCYSVGGTAEKVVSGKDVSNALTVEYTLSFADKDYLFYQVTESTFSTKKTYAIKVSDFVAKDLTKAVEIKNVNYATSASLIESLEETYSINDGTLVKVSLLESLDYNQDTGYAKEIVAIGDFSKLLFIKDGSVYYINSNAEIMRILLSSETAEEVQVSASTTDSVWYTAEVVDETLFYLDNSADGQSYMHAVALDGAVAEEDTDDDEESDRFYLEGQKIVGKMSDTSVAAKFDAKVESLSANELTLDKDEDGNVIMAEGKATFEDEADVKELRLTYDSMTKAQKKLVKKDSVTKLENKEAAIRVSKSLYELFNKTATELNQARVKEIRAEFNALNDTQKAMVVTNGLYWLQQAESKLA